MVGYPLKSSISSSAGADPHIPSASGLVVGDANGIPILSVVSSSKGQTPITSLVAKSGTGTISPQWQNNNFSTGSNGDAPSKWTATNSSWANWVTKTDNDGTDSYGDSFGFTSATACIIPEDTVLAANQTAKQVVATSTLTKDFDTIGTTTEPILSLIHI